MQKLTDKLSIAVVIPAYLVADQIAVVLKRISDEVQFIIVVDDASPDNLQEVLKKVLDSRLVILRHDLNQGVGAAMMTGFSKAIELEADIVVKIDGDGQMDPELISKFIKPLAESEADFTKGNRFSNLAFIRNMPLIRRMGNVALSFLAKMASGYWSVFDPCNGYIALKTDTLKMINFDRLAKRYFFEISLLCEAYLARLVLKEIPMKALYGDEKSSLNPLKIILEFSSKLITRTFYRIFMSYFLRDFNIVSIFLLAGLPLFIFGMVWSAYHWMIVLKTNTFASTGTIMIGVLSIILGFQLLLQSIVLDVQNEPKKS